MTIIKCKMCGGDIELSADKTFGTCEYCGCSMTFPKIENEQRAAAFNRGNHFRRIGEFDKALAVYEKIVSENEQDAEAHWCCALCRFGIEYVEDPNTYEWFPTCHRVSFDSFLEDVDYKAAVEHSEGVTKRQYIKEGMKIAEVQKGILLTSRNTKSYDIFLCYKESDENGNRTRDSILAQEIYYRLTEQGRSVFFSRITLEDVPGTRYEPYIFAALNSAKVMIVVGTKPEYLNAPWVKNEWSRFLTLMKKDRSKLMIPCYRDMDPYDLPEQLGVLQSFDMGKIGFLQDLTHGISKVLDRKTSQQEKIVVQQATANPATLMKRVFFFLEDGDWKAADEYCEKVLDIDPEYGEAYFGKLMAEYKISREADISNIAASCLNSSNFQKALRFADQSLQEKLENIRKDIIYRSAKKLAEQGNSREQQKGNLREAIRQLQDISNWRNSDALIAEWQAQLQSLREQEEAEQQERQRRKQQKEEKRNTARKKQQSFWTSGKISFLKKWIVVILCVVILAELLIFGGLIPEVFRKETSTAESDNTQVTEYLQPTETAAAEIPQDAAELSEAELQYRQAEAWEADGQLGRAAIAFGKLGDYKNAWEKSFELWRKIVPAQVGYSTNPGEAVVKKDGTVLLLRYSDTRQCECQVWTDIVAVSSTAESSGGRTVGLKKDGTVVAVGANQRKQCDTSSWLDVVAIDTSFLGFTVGLKSDGTVLYTGSAVEDVQTQIQDVSAWKDIAAIRVIHDSLFGIKLDGTLVVAKLSQSGANEALFKDWSDVIAVDYTQIRRAGKVYTLFIGLKADGTLISTDGDLQDDFSQWFDIIAIDGGSDIVVGLKSDGTVICTGLLGAKVPFDVSDWCDITTIYWYRNGLIGIKKDGSMVYTDNIKDAEIIKKWGEVQLHS